MSKKLDFSFELPSDNEGYIEYECPICKAVFRLDKNLFQGEKENDSLFCPICNMQSSIQNFYTTECIEYISDMRSYLANDYLDKELKNVAKKSKGLIKYKSKGTNLKPKMYGLHPNVETKHFCKKCNETFKTSFGSIVIYCPFCGDII